MEAQRSGEQRRQERRQRWGVAVTSGLGAAIGGVLWGILFGDPGPVAWVRQNLNLLAFTVFLTLLTSEFVGPWLAEQAPPSWRRVLSGGSTNTLSSQQDRFGIRVRRQSVRLAVSILFAFVIAVGKTALDLGLQGTSFLLLRVALVRSYLLVGARRHPPQAAKLGLASGAAIGALGGILLAFLLQEPVSPAERIGSSTIEWTIWGLAAGVALDRTRGARTGLVVIASLSIGSVLAHRIETWIWGPSALPGVFYLLFPAVGWGLVLAASGQARSSRS